MGKAFVGTSGFMYSHWKGVFYPSDLPQRDWFSFFVKEFDAVELNVSFYRLPKKEVFAGWRKKAGENFVFSIKGSRFITHIKRLKDCQEPVKRFFESAIKIKREKDIVLWQLPPRFKANPEQLSRFLKLLPKNWRHAFEFRDESWLSEKIYKMLKQYNTAIVFQDYPDWPISEKITADFVYLRFHGKTHLYTSCYTEKELTGWANKIKAWQKKGLDCYAFFNNDALGYAVENAKQFRGLCLKKKK